MMSEHLIYYLWHISVRFKASDKSENDFFDKEQAHVWETMKKLFQTALFDSKKTQKIYIYMIPNTESEEIPKPGSDYVAVVFTRKGECMIDLATFKLYPSVINS